MAGNRMEVIHGDGHVMGELGFCGAMLPSMGLKGHLV